LNLNTGLEAKKNGRAFACHPSYSRLGCSTFFGNAGLHQRYSFYPAAEMFYKPPRTIVLTEMNVVPQVERKESKPTE